ncbi:hypothetical protein MJO28_000843 [Puccinia striiformis f. sp. tritici]|uniref:Uncharacterized protein n=2 Tax=Puccinia striiformis TaxID=27350 RepID=A0A2S4VIL3_9BASI|nr:hypothetical protein MJO28_000843 [Puccinia striiformis f. sp. tritici]KAI7967140.1 hypothetical protein MJO29_000417 [Puccinia striiformis f. sp. tritici]KAI9603483.1 hypothetical protein KEM48_001438 [Puccinia striiformis f. sp. tritici PST-130]POW09319.1 hypothetical protein PSTT_06909 [Puccinia striiformis]
MISSQPFSEKSHLSQQQFYGHSQVQTTQNHQHQYSSPPNITNTSTVHPSNITNTSTVHPPIITNTSTAHSPNITNNLFLSTEHTGGPTLSLGVFFILNNQSIQLMSPHPHISIMEIHNRAGLPTPIKIMNLLTIFVLH